MAEAPEAVGTEAIRTLIAAATEGVAVLADIRAEMRAISARLSQLLAAAPGAAAGTPVAGGEDGDYAPGRERDPGDAVPPGVAVMTPAPLNNADEAVLHSLEALPKRGGRKKGAGSPRAKA